MFGVVPEAIGTGAARVLMEAALARAAQPEIGRVWLHTCTFDHPAAVRFYLGARIPGVQIRDRGRRRPAADAATCRPTAAPHVPLIEPRLAKK